MDAPHQEKVRAVFLSKHKISLAFALQDACPCRECSFNHDPALMPAGYFDVYTAEKRSAREVSREVSRPKGRLYAFSDDQADVVSAYFDEDVDALGFEGVAEPCA